MSPTDQTRPASPTADALAGQISSAAKKGPPPVHLWNPPFCGDLDIRIARDGKWFYLGTPIGREPLVRLFASVLRRDEDAYFLVTPAERVGIRVDDVPFIGVDVRVEPPEAHGSSDRRDQRIVFVTNVEDETTLGPDRAFRLQKDAETGAPTPYIEVRARLEARIDRKTFYRLVDLGEWTTPVAGPEETPDAAAERRFGVWSCGRFFALATEAELEDAEVEAPQEEGPDGAQESGKDAE